MEASNDAAATKVFAVPELLENILLNLPISRLFTFQRVNSTFKGVIGGSVAIRRRMFLEPTQIYNREDMNQLLSDLTLRQATYPFVLRLREDSTAVAGPLIDAELSCSWMDNNRTCDGEKIFRSQKASQLIPSWRSIKILQDESGFAIVISCEGDYWMCGDLPRYRLNTLGRVVDKANQPAFELWSGPWSIACSENFHLGPTRMRGT